MVRQSVPTVKNKPGNKGDFHGQRDVFLRANMDNYLAASKKGKTRNFWPELFKNYLEKFHWRLPLDQEPSPNDNFPPDLGLSAHDIQEKAKVLTELKQSWYNHQCTAMGLTANPFTPWLSRLRRPMDKAPRRLPDYQFYMQHDDFKHAVNERFKYESWAIPRAEHLAKRCAVACKLFLAEPEEVKARIRKESEEEQEAVLKNWNDVEEGLPSTDPEEQEEARARFTSVVSPLLQALRAYTGYHITLIAGRITDNSFDLRSLHVGKTQHNEGEDHGHDFTQWDQKGYKAHILDQIHAVSRRSRNLGLSPLRRSPPTNTSTSPMAGTTPAIPNTNAPQNPTAGMTPDVPNTNAPKNPTQLPPLNGDLPAALAPSVWARPPTLEQSLQERIQARVSALEHMGDTELRRVNNLARSRGELARVKAAGMQKEPGPSQAKKRKRTGGKNMSRKRRGQNARGRDDDEASADKNESDDGEGASGSDGEGRKAGEATQTSDQTTTISAEAGTAVTARGAPATVAEVKAVKAPKWAKEARATLLRGEIGNEPAWKECMELWWVLEASAKFVSPVKGFWTDGRPEEIQTWIKPVIEDLDKFRDGHGYGFGYKSVNPDPNPEKLNPNPQACGVPAGFGSPKIETRTHTRADPTRKPAGLTYKFVVEWKGWWMGLNPEWRVQGDVLLKEVKGPVESLRKPGANGFLSVLTGLKWWWEGMGATEEWIATFEDVMWAMSAVLGKRQVLVTGTESSEGAMQAGGGSAVGSGSVGTVEGSEQRMDGVEAPVCSPLFKLLPFAREYPSAPRGPSLSEWGGSARGAIESPIPILMGLEHSGGGQVAVQWLCANCRNGSTRQRGSGARRMGAQEKACGKQRACSGNASGMSGRAGMRVGMRETASVQRKCEQHERTCRNASGRAGNIERAAGMRVVMRTASRHAEIKQWQSMSHLLFCTSINSTATNLAKSLACTPHMKVFYNQGD
ncbi:hypothetical protein B0H13DRAFT_1919662 [Mycena leptocephala]|nr:hypothetical protein B0H13DRAFT_1919662 [Mycena leptocephala]